MVTPMLLCDVRIAHENIGVATFLPLTVASAGVNFVASFDEWVYNGYF